MHFLTLLHACLLSFSLQFLVSFLHSFKQCFDVCLCVCMSVNVRLFLTGECHAGPCK